MRKINFIAGITLVLVSAWSCQKNEATDTQFSDLSAVESVALVASVDEVDGIIDDNVFYSDGFLDFSSSSGKGKHHDRSGYFSDCATFETTTVDSTETTIIGFDADCTDRKGNELSGTITKVKTVDADGGYTTTVTFSDFTVNGYVTNGTKTYSKIIVNANGNLERTSTVDLTIVTDAGTITKTGTRTREVTAGSDTDTYKDDEVTTTGTSTYTAADGSVISTEITTPLVKPADCKYIAQGVKQVTENGEVATLDYGDGTCDNVATLTAADGTVTEIELRRGRKDCKGSHR